MLAQLRTRTDQIRTFIDKGAFAAIYVPAFQAKDLALALDEHKAELSGRSPAVAVPAIARLVRSAYLLDAFGDLGNKQQILDAYDRFSLGGEGDRIAVPGTAMTMISASARPRHCCLGRRRRGGVRAEPRAGEAHKAITSKYTYNDDVFPILRDRCARCHVAGGVAPMSLMTYDEAFPWARVDPRGARRRTTCRRGTREDGFGAFKKAHTLSPRELDIILTWATGGNPRGRLDQKLPPVAAARTTGRWARRTSSLPLPSEFTVAADKMEDSHEFIVPTGTTEPRWVRAVDLLPGTPSIVRSATIFAEGARWLRARASSDGGTRPGPRTRATGCRARIRRPLGSAAFRLPAGAQLAVRIHYKKTWQFEGKPLTDRSTVGLYFAKDASAQELLTLALSSPGASAKDTKDVTFSRTLNDDVQAVAVSPDDVPANISPARWCDQAGRIARAADSAEHARPTGRGATGSNGRCRFRAARASRWPRSSTTRTFSLRRSAALPRPPSRGHRPAPPHAERRPREHQTLRAVARAILCALARFAFKRRHRASAWYRRERGRHRSAVVLEDSMWSRPGSGSIASRSICPWTTSTALAAPIRPDEQSQIESVARAELEAAYAGLRIRFTWQPSGFYRVSVVQDIPARGLPVAGASRRAAVRRRRRVGQLSNAGESGGRQRAARRGPRRASSRRSAKGSDARPHTSSRIRSFSASTSTTRTGQLRTDFRIASQFYGTLHWAFARPQLEEVTGGGDLRRSKVLVVVHGREPVRVKRRSRAGLSHSESTLLAACRRSRRSY